MRRLEKDRIQVCIVLPSDRLTSQDPEFVRCLTRKFTVRNKETRRRIHWSSYLDDGDDLEIPSLNGQQALLEDRLRLVHSQPFKPTIKDSIPRSVVEELYDPHYFIAIGHIGSGVMLVNYSEELRKIAGRRLNMWLKLNWLMSATTGDKDIEVAFRAERIAGSIERATGFRPEELEERKRLLLTRLIGSKSPNHSIRTILVG